jgi:murein DD-endopeptidase MepM/ murein hydrolase activator NlpD
MPKPKFHFNPKTLTYERIDNTIKHRIRKIGSHLFSGIVIGVICFLGLTLLVDSPKERMLRSENAQLEAQYELISNQLDAIQEVLSDMQQRDDNLYRVVVQAEPIPNEIRNSYSGSLSQYEDLRKKTNSELATSTTLKLNNIKRQVYVQSRSFDEIVEMAKNKEEMLLCIPAIQPVLNKDLKRLASGYGIRIDPIYKTPKMHSGMDFTGATDTEIYATGKGVVEFVGWKQGYGNAVVINHGFNYKTLYGHLNSFNVKKGNQVKRGDVIAFMGNTGKSTGTHLHYEVHYKGKPTNPTNYYFMDLSPEEYDNMVQLSSNYGNVFD